jgi:hypothetical protein
VALGALAVLLCLSSVGYIVWRRQRNQLHAKAAEVESMRRKREEKADHFYRRPGEAANPSAEDRDSRDSAGDGTGRRTVAQKLDLKIGDSFHKFDPAAAAGPASAGSYQKNSTFIMERGETLVESSTRDRPMSNRRVCAGGAAPPPSLRSVVKTQQAAQRLGKRKQRARRLSAEPIASESLEEESSEASEAVYLTLAQEPQGIPAGVAPRKALPQPVALPAPRRYASDPRNLIASSPAAPRVEEMGEE